MQVIFRVDASLLIGAGHVMRCLTLADQLKALGNDCLFICRAHPGHLGETITRKGHRLLLLPRAGGDDFSHTSDNCSEYSQWLGLGWEEDARQTFELIAGFEPDWLIVDHYALDIRWEVYFRNVAKNIMVIDDLANRSHDCDCLLDQNLGRVVKDYDGLLPAGCKVFIGAKYALLRPEFNTNRRNSLKRRRNGRLKRIFISFGGVDLTNLTEKVLFALEHSVLPANIELDIIMGASSPHLDEIRRRAEELPFRATVSVNVQDIAERMQNADFAIGAAGGSAWERACLGLPSLVIIQAGNQVTGARALGEAGAAIVLSDSGELETILSERLVELTNPVKLRAMSKASAEVTDGRGIDEVVRVLAGKMGLIGV